MVRERELYISLEASSASVEYGLVIASTRMGCAPPISCGGELQVASNEFFCLVGVRVQME